MKLINKRQKLDKQNLLNIRIVLDRSGSMKGSEKVTIDALNTYLSDIKKTGVKGLITLNTFLPSSEKSCAFSSSFCLLKITLHPTAVSQSPPKVFKKFLSAKAHICV